MRANRLVPAAMLFGAVVLAAGTASAADPTAPVKEIMTATEANWAEDGSEFQNLFSEDRLNRLYSEEFVALFRKASDNAFAQEAGTPFDYDVIVNAQDGCPLEDVTIKPQSSASGRTVVVARFKSTTCFGDDPDFQKATETRFEVVEDGGHAVIDDIRTPDGDGGFSSLKNEMRTFAEFNTSN
ncbi:hypothetical protein [Amorphus sp. 3PC139-8]|uniref:hypothetical protein n=1 Tax=Amorphus sp. 3PC139-8 TaxID=2735676 RepID=UPI00345DB096